MSLSFSCVEVDGILLTVIPDERVAMVEITEEEEEQQPLLPPELGLHGAKKSPVAAPMKKKVVSVTPLEGECYYEASTETVEHMVDVWTPTCAMVFHVSVSGMDIKFAKRLN